MKCALFRELPTQTDGSTKIMSMKRTTYTFVYASIQGYHISTASQIPKFPYLGKPCMNNSSTHEF